jgi:hypothetical protein
MAENPGEKAKSKGVWEGGASGHGENGQSSGRPSGFPGGRAPSKIGIRTDIDFPPPAEKSDKVR